MSEKTIDPANEYLLLVFLKMLISAILPIVLNKLLFQKRMEELERQMGIPQAMPKAPTKK